MHAAERRQHIGGRKDGWNFKKKGKMSLLPFRSTLAHQTVKRRGTMRGRDRRGGDKGRNDEIELVKRSTSFNADNEVILQKTENVL